MIEKDRKSEPLVVRLEERPRDGWDDPAKGRIAWWTFFSGDVTPTDTFTAGIAELKPGDWLAPHRHAPAEIYYVLEGSGVLTLAGSAQTVSAGAAVFIPGNVEHGMRNQGTETVRVFYAFAVDSFADVEYRF